MNSISLALIMAAGAVFSASAGQFRKDINPALQYYQAFLMAPNLSPADRDYLYMNAGPGQKLPERCGQLVAEYNAELRLVRQAARAAVPCDWGIDMTLGPAALLPHLSRAKAAVQAAMLRVAWDLQNGRTTEAREDLLAALALGRNVSRDGMLISALVEIAMESIVCVTVAENFGQFPPETLKHLAEGFDAAPARGTMAACITTENFCFQDSMMSKILELQQANPGKDDRVMAEIHELFLGEEGPEPGQTNIWERVVKAAGGTSDGIVKLLHDEGTLYQRLAVIMALPRAEFEGQMKQFNAEIQHSTNPFVSLAFPAVENARRKEFLIQVQLAMVRAAVEYKLQGEQGLKRVMDPCGEGPFAFRRFVFEGVDRGFELKSTFTYPGRGYPEVLIFLEKEGPPVFVNGQKAGQAWRKSTPN